MTDRIFRVRTQSGITSRNDDDSARVLVVDDQAQVRRVTRLLLQALGYEVQTVDDGASALQTLANDSSHIAAVLLDESLPDMCGTEVVRKMRTMRVRVPVVLTSGLPALDAAASALAPAVAFLRKPYDVDQLREVLDFAVHRSTQARAV